MRSRFFFGIIFLLLPMVCAQAAERFIVREIDISGLRNTHEWVVRRELHFAVGDTVDNTALQAAQRRLLNNTVFNNASLTHDSLGTVHILMTEAWPWLPEISVDLVEGQISDVINKPHVFFEKATIYAGIAHRNFLKDAGRVFVMGQFGAAQGVDVRYDTRWLTEKIPIAVSAMVSNLRILDRHAAVLDSTRHIRQQVAELSVATRYGAPSRLGLALRYQIMRSEQEWPADGRTTKIFQVSPYVILDRRDLEWYPTRGALAYAICDAATGTETYSRLRGDLNGYFPFAGGKRPPLLALHVGGATSSSTTPSWAHYYHGFSTVLRGYQQIKSESSGYLVADAEVRFPLTGEGTFHVRRLGRYGERLPWGVMGMAFVQRAQLSYNGDRTQRLSWGGGLYVRLPYVQILEISAAQGRGGRTQYFVGSGVRF